MIKNRLIHFILVLMLLSGSLAFLPAGSLFIRLGPQESFIVQAESVEGAQAMVKQSGGAITHRLGIINAVGAKLTQAQADWLQSQTGVKVFRDQLVTTSTEGNFTFLDGFSPRSYSNNDGTNNWSGSWIETGDDGKVDGGSLQVLSAGYAQLKDKNRSLRRAADLSGAAGAVLSFSYRRYDELGATNYVMLQVSADGGASWTELDRFGGTGKDSAFIGVSYDISAYVSANTLVRFVTSGGLGSKKLYVDNVMIECTPPLPTPTPEPTVPPVVLDKVLRDDFNIKSYNNNDGTTLWSAPWAEIWEYTDPGSGYADVTEVSQGYNLHMKQGLVGVTRAANLYGATSATLSFRYRRVNFEPGDVLQVVIYASGGSGFNVVGQITGPATDTEYQTVTYDLMPYILPQYASMVRVGFQHSNWVSNTFDFYADEVILAHNAPSISNPSVGSNVVPLINASAVHAQGKFGSGVTVAVIDSGYWNHPFLETTATNQYRIQRQYNAILGNDDGNAGVSTEEYGHGTHVTSILLSAKQDTLGRYLGVAPGAKLVSVKAFDSNGIGAYTDIIRGIDWIIANKNTYNIRVVNMSFSGTPQSYYWEDPLNQAVMRAWQAGIVMVAAAGNTGPDAMSIGVPGNVPYIITVGAMTDNYTPTDALDDRLASFSASGPTVEGFVKPDILAPGGHVLGLMPASSQISLQHPAFQSTYDEFTMSGTSQATAGVSGVVALMLENNPGLTPDQVKQRLMATARPALNTDGSLAYSILQQGAGLVNAYDAVYASVEGAANNGMDIGADLAGTQHYGGYVNRDAEGNYYLMDVNGYTWAGSVAGSSWVPQE